MKRTDEVSLRGGWMMYTAVGKPQPECLSSEPFWKHNKRSSR